MSRRVEPEPLSEDTEGRRPNPVDLHVGGRVRMRRKLLGVSQEQLADSLGLTFQQVQKYERGANRVSCSKLWAIGRHLAAPPAFFFEGLDDAAPSPSHRATEFLSLAEGLDLAETFPRIKLAHVRRHIASLVRTLAYAEAGEAAGAT
jgi:transcriptional regulator with XRE-family HTH domain